MEVNEARSLIERSEAELKSQFERLDDIALFNQKKVLNAFSENSIQARHMYGTTGYGYDDCGRDALCDVYSEIFRCESALVSPMIASGTHALTLMLFAALRPGDKLLAVSGKPYDTLTDVIDGENKGSLRDFGVKFDYIDLTEIGTLADFDYKAIENALRDEKIKAVFAARSRGYAWRQAIGMQKISELCEFVKKVSPDTLVLIDNCYGEFVEKIEPSEVGADLIAGSLIKNIGGGIAPTGGYVAGKAHLVEQAAFRHTAPSIGREEGSYAYGYLPYYQGLFFAPSVVKNALKGSLLFAKAYSDLGFETLPDGNCAPYDIVTSVKMDSPERLIAFCRAIQEVSPIDSNVKPEPWDMPGYKDKVIMAAGAFVQGSSIELSADGPIREPYTVYVQGGLTYEHAKIALEHTLIKCV